MADLELPHSLEEICEVSIGLLYDSDHLRPILVVSQSYRGNARTTLRYALSPAASVPAWLIGDVLATFQEAVVNKVRFAFGIQEELELRSSTSNPQDQGGLSTAP